MYLLKKIVVLVLENLDIPYEVLTDRLRSMCNPFT